MNTQKVYMYSLSQYCQVSTNDPIQELLCLDGFDDRHNEKNEVRVKDTKARLRDVFVSVTAVVLPMCKQKERDEARSSELAWPRNLGSWMFPAAVASPS